MHGFWVLHIVLKLEWYGYCLLWSKGPRDLQSADTLNVRGVEDGHKKVLVDRGRHESCIGDCDCSNICLFSRLYNFILIWIHEGELYHLNFELLEIFNGTSWMLNNEFEGAIRPIVTAVERCVSTVSSRPRGTIKTSRVKVMMSVSS